MAQHYRLTRNRREFLTGAFCGFGALARKYLAFADGMRAGSVAEQLVVQFLKFVLVVG